MISASSFANQLPPLPRFLQSPSPATIQSLLDDPPCSDEIHDARTALILRHALRHAAEHCDSELLMWLTALTGQHAAILDEEVQLIEDEDGWGLVGMTILGSCGSQEKEECTRAVVLRWGLEVGPRKGRDRGGWTPLHLSALVSTAPLISFLLTRGASCRVLTNRGLTPLDLIAGLDDRQEVAVLLEHATSTGPTTSAILPEGPWDGSLSAQRQSMLGRRRSRAVGMIEQKSRLERLWKMEAERGVFIRETVRVVGVNPEYLLNQNTPGKRLSADSGLGWIDDESTAEESESDYEDDSVNKDIHETLLVFSLSQLPIIFDIFITARQPYCFPVEERAVPANAIYLYARFAHYRCDQSWLEELIEGAVEKIEQGVYSNVEDLAFLSYWAYNTTVLLHLLRSDAGLEEACEKLGFISMMEELINAIHVFVIRVAERRIDIILDASLLDYENLEEVGDVRFEGEWTLFRSFGGKKKRELLPKASQIFNNGITSSPRNRISESPSTRSIQGAMEEVTPQSITDILTGVLVVLQIYDVNPALTVQAFSQIFYWIASELFNRILTRKKYLCRSKAVQIRMNITALDDWVRSHGIPSKTATKHLEPVAQLLQWLQCSSQIKEFDTLIGTLQNMRSLNPMQMRRAVRDYRYEVNEGKMSEECTQYLSQLQKDWDRRRVQMSMEVMKNDARRRSSDDTNETTCSHDIGNKDDSTSIDALFDGTTSLADFTPQAGPECIGELLDPRHMLHFNLPSDNTYLIATPPKDAAFNTMSSISPFITDSINSRPSSRDSFSSAKPLGWSLPSETKLRKLPKEFFTWLRRQERDRKYQFDLLRPRMAKSPALDPPLGPSQRVTRPIKTTPQPVTIQNGTYDEDSTPIATSVSFPIPSATFSTNGVPSPGLRTSSSVDELREKAKNAQLTSSFETVPRHKRTESYELKTRSIYTPTPMRNGVMSTTEDKDSTRSVSSGSGSKWWRLGRRSGGMRDGSEDTITDGMGMALDEMDVLTPVVREGNGWGHD
ncbi:hypothetical protein TREMEDRAFT_25958 [Tremella mesenterica DSM 1558]|uniref:uncharacterized protein n=1 Tax=Tremella mesenterica (strain ATCC 24925 / CBS 8224 / DSM 1558 / NBRC 9311 / NRRL Y-6157 / RJB 2259-6 / UBC 559-6) TaxID=578456 RepID=UPI0003F4A023|nr:uncharacterized protein TREMEDRAFT_25958 [Tremella mesenterica DSM 1558]EIW72141.1 hypothetical protein TREMEDRAFT_25958 [Tremella mesenterica DSM 1558]